MITATSSPGRAPPGPRGWPVLGILPRIWWDPLRFFSSVSRECGGVARIGLGKFTLYLITSPSALDRIFQENARNYWKGKGLAAAERVMGQGLATSEGELWERQHRMIQPLFRPQRLAGYVPLLHGAVLEAVERWRHHVRRGRPFDASSEIRQLTLVQICRMVFGDTLSPEEIALVGDAVDAANDEINRSAWTLVPWISRLPTPRNLRVRRLLRDLDLLVNRAIHERRARPAGEGPRDLLDHLLAARDSASGEGMGDRQVRDELVTMFVAGHDTPANGIAWMFHQLSRHPEWVDRLAREAGEVLGTGTPRLEEIDRLEIAERVLKESLRLHPPAWIIVRTPREDDVLDGFDIPAGAPLLLSQYVVHRQPELWEGPEVFDPDRWLPERSTGRHRFSYFPFGGGSRFCVGQALAMLLGKLAAAELSRAFHWEPATRRPVRERPLTTLQPRGGVWVRARERG